MAFLLSVFNLTAIFAANANSNNRNDNLNDNSANGNENNVNEGNINADVNAMNMIVGGKRKRREATERMLGFWSHGGDERDHE